MVEFLINQYAESDQRQCQMHIFLLIYMPHPIPWGRGPNVFHLHSSLNKSNSSKLACQKLYNYIYSIYIYILLLYDNLISQIFEQKHNEMATWPLSRICDMTQSPVRSGPNFDLWPVNRSSIHNITKQLISMSHGRVAAFPRRWPLTLHAKKTHQRPLLLQENMIYIYINIIMYIIYIF